jgi:hypothetical protein
MNFSISQISVIQMYSSAFLKPPPLFRRTLQDLHPHFPLFTGNAVRGRWSTDLTSAELGGRNQLVDSARCIWRLGGAALVHLHNFGH